MSSSSSAPRAALRLARSLLLRRAPQHHQQQQAHRRLVATTATATSAMSQGHHQLLAAPSGAAGVAAGTVQRSQPVCYVSRRRMSAAAAAAAAPSDGPITAQEANRLVKIATNSKLANRDDVRSALAAALEAQGVGQGAEEVKQMDQVLFKGVFPSNMWVVALGSREAAQRLLRQGQVQSPSGNLRVEEVREGDLARLQLASTLGLDACSVHVQNVPANMGADEVAYFFRDFRLRPDGIRPLPTEAERLAQQQQQQQQAAQAGQDDSQQQHLRHRRHQHQQYQRQFRSFVVKFATPDEAQRAIREKQAEQWGMGKVQIVSYK